MLPTVIRSLGLAHAGRRERHADREEEFAARRLAIEAAIERLDQLASDRQLSDEIVRPLRAHYRDRLKHVEHRSDGGRGHRKLAELNDEIEFQLIEAERQAINDRYRRGQLKDEARRRVERELDLRDLASRQFTRRELSAARADDKRQNLSKTPRIDNRLKARSAGTFHRE